MWTVRMVLGHRLSDTMHQGEEEGQLWRATFMTFRNNEEKNESEDRHGNELPQEKSTQQWCCAC